MKILASKIKLFGKVGTLFQVVDASGEVLRVFSEREEAEEWVAAQQS